MSMIPPSSSVPKSFSDDAILDQSLSSLQKLTQAIVDRMQERKKLS